jgi:hypothetical protein
MPAMNTKVFAGVLSLIVCTATGTAKADGLGADLKTSVALDLVSALYTSESSDKGYKVDVRSAELMLYGPIDHLFEGVLNFAGHTESGEFFFEIHEAYVGSSKLVPSSRFRVGKFLLGLGRLNQFHQHDWHFTSAPMSHEIFFADESAADTGVEYTYLLPTDHFFEITLGVTNGYCYGHCHSEGEKSGRPLMYLHPLTFFEFSSQSGLQLGLSYLTRRDSLQIETQLAGFDLVFKKRDGKRLTWLTQTEAYLQYQDSNTVAPIRKVGGYHLTQYGLSESWSLGLRLDLFSDLSQRFQTTGERRKDLDYALVPIATWKPSEFSTLRFSYTYSVDTTQGDADTKDHLAQIQFSYLLGAHPPHEF